MYSPMTNRWANVHSLGQEPEALGGHSASVAGDLMVVFGGSPRPGMGLVFIFLFRLFIYWPSLNTFKISNYVKAFEKLMFDNQNKLSD